MRVCACMCVYVRIFCVDVRMYAFICVFVCGCMYICIVCMCVFCVCMYVCMHVCIVCMCVFCVCMYLCMYVCMLPDRSRLQPEYSCAKCVHIGMG